ncbi:SDR family NAD(P)-dependent oxidoreductase [Draconibacterium halophilum]|uniref:SDR family NAD(P)-dependent oxidoreductase n=1 Tax=Draconibacterium halophilum TaxID=2706887 RepID=A0A6C0RF17_9BACT|nr:SDR family NAD(P)-dependent oxidoreductase [Draconibacterium halophilum]QIA09104.1 SDR family NAD(P)-dependent oxidoreductase [Draconibacterium halophilum]
MKILITGTSSGLGFGLAKYYLIQNHTVYGISRRSNTELNSFDNFAFLSQDISDFDDLRNNLAEFLRETDKFDLVILNAGMLNDIKDMKETSLEEIKKVMDVNVWSNKIIIDTLFTELEDISRIVAISSGASVSGARGWNAYSLSKATLNMLISLYANEQPQTHFCALAPGLIDTGMQEYLSGLHDTMDFPTVERLKKARSSGEMPTIEEAAKTNAEAIEKLKSYDTGSFVDVRKI